VTLLHIYNSLINMINIQLLKLLIELFQQLILLFSIRSLYRLLLNLRQRWNLNLLLNYILLQMILIKQVLKSIISKS